MASLNRIKPGQILYTLTRGRAGNTTIRVTRVHTVRVLEVDLDNRRVLASWDNNTPEWCDEHRVKRWKVNKPEVKKDRLF